MTNLLDIIHRLFLIKTHNVSETGVCLRHQVKYNYSVGPNRCSQSLSPDPMNNVNNTPLSQTFRIYVTDF
jgi:hypothetical protein